MTRLSGKNMRKTTLREIKQSFGRYVAILAIIALGVGFFAGLKIVKPSMVEMADGYWQEMQLFDYRLLSTIGFDEEDVEAFRKQEDVSFAEGVISADILYIDPEQNESVMKVHSLPEKINGIRLTAGRMPEASDECVVDSHLYTEESIGTKITLTDTNEEEDLELFVHGEYTIVGIAQSSYYANFERGNTALGTGKVSGFMYIPGEGFDCDYFTEVFVKLDHNLPIYSEEYEDYIEAKEDTWEELCRVQTEARFDSFIEDAQEEIDDARTELEEEREDAEDQLAQAEQELLDAEADVESGEEEIANTIENLDLMEEDLNEKEDLLNTQKQDVENQLLLLQSSGISIDQGLAMMPELQAAQQKLLEAEGQIEAGRADIEEARGKIEEKKVDLEDAKQEIADGWVEYENSKVELDDEIAEAEAKLADAQAKLDDLEEPDYYVLQRNSNIGYACFESDSSIIDGIANVVPLFFFMVAALVCMTTMNRMVEEQRTQIGVLKALGYGEGIIMSKYLFYSGSAAIIGCVLGFFGGTWLFPKVIWTAYCIMYTMEDVHYIFDGSLALVSLLVAILCSMGATWFTCKNELSETAANLMRPKAPKAGKRVFLEYIPFVWKRMKFLYKVSVRNIFRYKKRFFMMVAGISGCTALLVTGFGIKDSVADVADQQFEQIQIYDMSVSFKDAQNAGEETAFTKEAAEAAEKYAYFSEKSVDLEFDGKIKAVNLVVTMESETEEYLRFGSTDGEPVERPGDGEAILSHKLAQTYGIGIGDTILLRDEDMHQIEVKISGIFENFIYNYVYINAETYKQNVGEEAEFKTAYVNLKEGHDAHQVSAAFMKLEEVSAVTVNADTRERFASMMTSLDYVVALIIFCAAFLAFIVLYNLTNINITERIREIATLKVLGFYKKESASYVFRENLILAVIGSGVGLLLGKALHAFVMSQINVDMVAFDVRISARGYVYSILLTLLFASVVNLFMSVKLEKINMAESLKSVD